VRVKQFFITTATREGVKSTSDNTGSEIGVGLEFSYFSEVAWAVLDAANKASGENAWGSSRLLTELS